MYDSLDTKFFEAMIRGCLSSNEPDDMLLIKGSHGDERLVRQITPGLIEWCKIMEHDGIVRIYVNPANIQRCSSCDYTIDNKFVNYTTVFVRAFGQFSKAATPNVEGRRLLALLPEPNIIIDNYNRYIDLLWFCEPVQDPGHITSTQRIFADIIKSAGYKVDKSAIEIHWAAIPLVSFVAMKKPTEFDVIGDDQRYRPELIKCNADKKLNLADYPIKPKPDIKIDCGNQSFVID